MSGSIPKCSTCKNEIPVGKYYELHVKQPDAFYKYGDYCSPCWDKERFGFEIEIKKGNFKVIEAEREREREQKEVSWLWKTCPSFR